MSSFLNMAKEMAESQLGGNQSETVPAGKPHGSVFPTFADESDDEDGQKVAKHASRMAGSSGDSSMFSSIMGSITQNKNSIANDDSDIDEEYATKQHKKHFQGQDDDSGSSSQDGDRSMGTAAAMEALRMFTQGGSGSGGGGGGGKSQFMALAMSQATQLFDAQSSQGKVPPSASKESTVQKAGEMALKMYLKSQGQSGGASGLMSLASRFM